MDPRLLGHACSVLRVAGVAGVVLTAFLRLPAADFIGFSQFHVGLSLAGFIECVAAIERSRLYTAGTQGVQERQALLRAARGIGLFCLLVGAALSIGHLQAGALVAGAGIACLGLTEAAVLREKPGQAGRAELAVLAGLLVLIAATWVLPGLPLGLAAALLALLACGPRVTLATLWRLQPGVGTIGLAVEVLKRNLASIAPFAASQAALPWLFAIPTYVVPQHLPAREASWLLLGLRASGAISSMLARTMVQRWIRLVDGLERAPALPQWPTAVLVVMSVVVGGAGAASVAPPLIAGLFACALSLACALMSLLSTHLNAHGRYLSQVPAFAVFWLTGSAMLLTAGAMARPLPLLALFAATQLLGACIAVLWMIRLSSKATGMRKPYPPAP